MKTTSNHLKLFQQVKPPLYAKFVSNSTNSTKYNIGILKLGKYQTLKLSFKQNGENNPRIIDSDEN